MTSSLLKRSHLAGLLVGIVAIGGVWMFFSSSQNVSTFLGGVGLTDDAVNASLALQPTEVRVQKGDEFRLRIELTTGRDAAERHRALVSFDSKRLQVVDAEASTAGIAPTVTYDNVTGEVSVLGTAANANATTVLATVTFRASQTLGDTELAFVEGNAGSYVLSAERGDTILNSVGTSRVSVVLHD